MQIWIASAISSWIGYNGRIWVAAGPTWGRAGICCNNSPLLLGYRAKYVRYPGEVPLESAAVRRAGAMAVTEASAFENVRSLRYDNYVISSCRARNYDMYMGISCSSDYLISS